MQLALPEGMHYLVIPIFFLFFSRLLFYWSKPFRLIANWGTAVHPTCSHLHIFDNLQQQTTHHQLDYRPLETSIVT